MGTHISKVKSVDLDTWLPDQVENMVKWGNARAAIYWEANLKDRKPSESNIDGWIRAKYEHKRWAMKGPVPDPSTLGDGSETVSATAQPSQPAAVQPVVAPKPKSSSDFANLNAFLGAPSATQRVANPSSPPNQLHGANFFSMANEEFDTPLLLHPRANASAGGLGGGQQPTTSYANNLGNYQQQLSGLAMGPPSGMIPQPPPQQANQYQNVWGGFQEGSSQQAWSNNNNDFTSFNQAPAFQQQNSMPQGGQFFSTDYSNRPASANSTSPSNPPQRPNFDAFADLANFGS
ncbi:unnamed protein product [Umbelopsis ramanniana]